MSSMGSIDDPRLFWPKLELLCVAELLSCGRIAVVMPPKEGVRQRLRREREEAEIERNALAGGVGVDEPAEQTDTMRTWASGGRKRSRTLGEFLTGMYLVGRMSAPELQESAEQASASGPSSSSSGALGDLGKAGS